MLRFVNEESGTNTFDGVDIILQSTTDEYTFTIGRALSSDLVIALPSLSREHCKFTTQNGKWFLEDTSSSGTWLNDKQLLKNKPRALNDKDLIKLSTDCLVYEFKSLPCTGLGLGRPRLCNSQLKIKEVNDKIPLSQLSSTPDSNIKENTTLHGHVPESQIKVLAAEEAEKRKKLEDVYASDLQALKTKYEEELKQVNIKLELAEQKELSFQRKQEEWKHEKEFLTFDIEKRKDQLDKVRDEYAQQLRDEKHKLQLEVTRREKEGEILKQKVKQLEQQQQLHTVENHNHVKEKQLIVEENKLLLQEKIRLEEEVKRLTEALELSSSEVTTLKGEINVLNEEKEALVKTVSDLNFNVVEIEERKILDSENQLQTFEQLMESELQCAICTEIVVNAQTLVCGHTFCQICIDEWRDKNPHCPNCRKKVKRTYPSKVLDGFVGKMVDNLTADFKRKREQIVLEKDEHVAYKRLRLVEFQNEPEAFIDLTSPNHSR